MNFETFCFLLGSLFVFRSLGNVANAFSNSINMANLEKKFLFERRRRRKRDAFSDFNVYIDGDIDSVLLVLDGDFFSEGLKPEEQTVFDEFSNYQTDVLSQIVKHGVTDSSEGDMIMDLSSQMFQEGFGLEDIGNAVSRGLMYQHSELFTIPLF